MAYRAEERFSPRLAFSKRKDQGCLADGFRHPHFPQGPRGSWAGVAIARLQVPKLPIKPAPVDAGRSSVGWVRVRNRDVSG